MLDLTPSWNELPFDGRWLTYHNEPNVDLIRSVGIDLRFEIVELLQDLGFDLYGTLNECFVDFNRGT